MKTWINSNSEPPEDLFTGEQSNTKKTQRDIREKADSWCFSPGSEGRNDRGKNHDERTTTGSSPAPHAGLQSLSRLNFATETTKEGEHEGVVFGRE